MVRLKQPGVLQWGVHPVSVPNVETITKQRNQKVQLSFATRRPERVPSCPELPRSVPSLPTEGNRFHTLKGESGWPRENGRNLCGAADAVYGLGFRV